MAGDLVIAALTYLAYVGTSLVIGAAALRLAAVRMNWSYAKLFATVSLGHATIVLVTSVLRTGGRTINVLLLLLLVFAVFVLRRRHSATNVSSPGDSGASRLSVLTVVVLLLVPYGIKTAFYYDTGYRQPNIPHADHLYYMTIAEFMRATGNENFLTAKNLLFPEQFGGVSPYRYHDMWTHVAVSYVTPLRSVAVYELVASPILLLLALLGFVAVIEACAGRVGALHTGMAILFLFIGYNKMGLLGHHVDPQGPAGYQKLCVFYAVFCATYLLFKAGKEHLGAIVAMALAAFSVSAVPVLAAGSLFGVYVSVARKKLDVLVIAGAAAAVVVGLFYALFGVGLSDVTRGPTLAAVDLRLVVWKIKDLVVKLIFWHLPLIMVIPLVWSRAIRQLSAERRWFIFVGCVTVCAIGFQALVAGVPSFGDPNQFATNSLIPLGHVLFLSLVSTAVLVDVRRWKNAAVATAVTAYLCFSAAGMLEDGSFLNRSGSLRAYDRGYLEAVQGELAQRHNPVGGFLVAKSFYVNGNRAKEFFLRPGNYVKTLASGFDLVSLSVDLIPATTPTFVAAKANSALSIYSRINRLPLTDTTRARFLTDKRIEFVIAGPGATVPQSVSERATRVLHDPRSGESFYVLGSGQQQQARH